MLTELDGMQSNPSMNFQQKCENINISLEKGTEKNISQCWKSK